MSTAATIARPVVSRLKASSWCRLAVVAIVALTASVAFVASTPAPVVLAVGGLEVEAQTTYIVNPEEGTVDVIDKRTYTNVVPDRREGDTIKQTYFTGAGTAIPASAKNIVATAEGSELTTRREPVEGLSWAEFLEFDFPRNIFYQSTLELEVTYSIEGAAPRSKKDESRVNPAFAAFYALTLGDPGMTQLTLVIPNEFEIDDTSELFDLEPTDFEGNQVFILGEDYEFPVGEEGGVGIGTWIAVVNDDNLASTKVEVGEHSFDVRGWDEDTEWTNFVSETINTGVPKLETIFGTPWPAEETTVIKESIVPSYYGYAGTFDPIRGISLGEELDEAVAFHELAHAWVNFDTLEERWLIEGLTEFAGLAAAGEESGRKTTFATFPLIEWSPGLFSASADEERERMGYDTSYHVVDSVFSIVGDERFDEVFIEVSNPRPEQANIADWQRFLDATDPIVATGPDGAPMLEPAASSEIKGLMDEYVVDIDGTLLLQDREETRDEVAEFEAGLGDWLIPDGIVQSISAWNFASATSQMSWASETVEARDELAQRIEETGLEVDTSAVARSFAEATTQDDLETVTAELGELQEAVAATDSAAADVADAGGFFYGAGSWLGDDPKEMVDEATEALAAGDAEGAKSAARRASDSVTSANASGQRRIGFLSLVVVALLASAIGLLLLQRRRKRNAAAGDADVDSPAIEVVNDPIDPAVSAPASPGADGVAEPHPVGVVTKAPPIGATVSATQPPAPTMPGNANAAAPTPTPPPMPNAAPQPAPTMTTEAMPTEAMPTEAESSSTHDKPAT